MDYISIITRWMLANIEWVLIGLSAIIFIALMIFIQINIKLSRVLKKYNELMSGVEGRNLENLLFDHVKRVDKAMERLDSIHSQCRKLSDTQEYCIQKVGIVRFNAFEDMGSDLSFSIALLDARDDGVIISSLFGRDESRTYGKPVSKGKSSYLLTDEEQKALQIASRQK